MNKDELSIAPRQLRRILFEVTNQEMTVRELRKLLCDIDEQDKPLDFRLL